MGSKQAKGNKQTKTKLEDVMSRSLVTVDGKTSVAEAARKMGEADAGDVLVTKGDTLQGIVTDRDIVLRGVARQLDLKGTSIGDLCTKELHTLPPDATIDQAARLMSEKAIRRIPVVKDGAAVGIISLGDVAIERDEGSPLAAVSAAAPSA